MALSDKDLAEIKPGCLVRVDWVFYQVNGSLKESIVTVKSVFLSEGGFNFTFEETRFTIFWRYPSEVSLIASTMESIPLEDWAGLAHLLHPKLKERVEQWLSQTKI